MLYLRITYWRATFFFFHRYHLLSSPFFSSLPPIIVVAQTRGHIAGSSPLLPTTVRALHFYREKIPALSSLVGKRRIVLAHAINRRSQQIVDPFLIFANKFQVSPRRDSNSRPNTSKGGSIRGLPLLILNRRPGRPYSGNTYIVPGNH